MTHGQYDVALSFAGEDRDYARRVAELLRAAPISVFFDEFEVVRLWGKDLAVEFATIYGRQSRYVVPFVSANYAAKAWTTHEFRIALATAIERAGECILPVRLDDTELPGLRGTIGYLDARKMSPEAIAQAILQKLGSSPQSPSGTGAATAAVTASPAAAAAPQVLDGPLADRIRAKGHWKIDILPAHVREDRFQIRRGLVHSVAQYAVDLHGWSLPHVNPNAPPLIEVDSIGQDTEWKHFHELWRLFKSGKFVHLSGMRHDWGADIQASPMEEDLAGARLLGIGDVIFRFTGAVAFASRYSQGLLDGDRVAVLLEVVGLQGRRLFVDDPSRYPLDEAHVATTQRPFIARIEVDPLAQKDVFSKQARECAHELFALFGFEIPDEQLEHWQGQLRSW